MKKFILPIVTCIITLSVLLTGCGFKGHGFYSNYSNSVIKYSSYIDVKAGLDGATFVKDHDGNLNMSEIGNVVVTKTVEGAVLYGVYNVNDGVYKYNLEAVDAISVQNFGQSGDVFMIDKKGSELFKYVRDNGEVLFDDVENAQWLGARTIKKVSYEAWNYTIDGLDSFVLYKTQKGVKKEHFKVENGLGQTLGNSEFVWAGELSEKLVDYVIESVDLSGENSMYRVINRKGKIVGEYEVNTEYMNGLAYVGEYIYFQYSYPLDAYASKFDYIDDGVKYDLVTERVTIKNGKVRSMGNFNYVIDGYGFPGEDFARLQVQKISNKLLDAHISAFLTDDGEVVEVKYNYGKMVRLSEDLLIAEDDESVGGNAYNVLHIIDDDGNIKVDLSSRDNNYNIHAHSDNVVVLQDATNELDVKYGMIDHDGKLLTKFEYDQSFGVVNGVWLAGKNIDNTTDGVSVSSVYAVNSKGEATLISEKKINVGGGDLVSNKFGDKDIVEFSTVDGVVAYVRENGSEAGKYNYHFYSFDNFTTPLVSFTNIESTEITTHHYFAGNKSNYLVMVGNNIGVIK